MDDFNIEGLTENQSRLVNVILTITDINDVHTYLEGLTGDDWTDGQVAFAMIIAEAMDKLLEMGINPEDLFDSFNGGNDD